MLDLYQIGKTKLKLNYLLKNNKQTLELYLCIPENHLSVNKANIDDSSWLYGGLITKRRYYSHHLSLDHFKNLLSAFIASEQSSAKMHNRVRLNDLWHQYKLALTKEIRRIKKDKHLKHIDNFYQSITAIQRCFEQQGLTATPPLNDLEDLINWYSYQSLQRLIALSAKPEWQHLSKIQPTLNMLVTKLYMRRKTMGYDIPETSLQLSQLFDSNSRKKRALSFSAIMKEKMISINNRYQLIVLGISAGAAMLGLYSLLAYLGGNNRQITLPLLSAIAMSYGVREVFKEGIKYKLGAFFKHHFFSWKRIIQDGASDSKIAIQWIAIHWLNEKGLKKIDGITDKLSLENYQILHYKSQSKLHKHNIPQGYEGMEESLILDFAPFSRQLLPEKEPILLLQPDAENMKKVHAIFKCYLIVVFDGNKKQQSLVEFHINKDRIINLTIKDKTLESKSNLQTAM